VSSAAGTAVTGTLTGIGSSAQNSAMEAWKTGFESANQGAKVQYSPDGSGAGRKAFLSGGAQFAGSDAYLDDEEMAQAKEVCGPDGAINVPVYISPIAIAFNLEGVTDLNLDAPTIAKIFKKEITTWNDPAIASQNEGVELPDTPITVVHLSNDSATTENAAAKAVEVATPVEGRSEFDMSLKLQRDTTEAGSYPVVLVSYHVYCTAYDSQETVDLVKAFGTYVVSEEGQAEAEASAGNAPLSASLSEKATAAIDSIKVAS